MTINQEFTAENAEFAEFLWLFSASSACSAVKNQNQ